MKKLFLFLFLPCAFATGMQPQKRTHQDMSKPIEYLNHAGIAPFYISAVAGESVVGRIDFGSSIKNSRHGLIEYLSVLPAHRGKGIGYQLFERAILTLKKKGFRIITWDAIGLDDISTEQLENVYIAYIHKLAGVLEFDFVMGLRLGCPGTLITPMKLIVKEAGGNYPEAV